MNANTQTSTLVQATMRLMTQEEKARSEGTQSLVFTLIVAHEEKQMNGVDLMQAFRHTERKAQKLRNDLLLTHLFSVKTVTHTDAGPVYKDKDNVPKKVIALLKGRLNRTLVVAAWLAKNGGTAQGKVKRNDSGLLSVRGSTYFTDEELKAAPDLADNWIVLDSKSGAGSGKFDVLATRAAKGLDHKKQTSGTKTDHVALASITRLSKALEDKLNLAQATTGVVISKEQLEELRKLFIVIADAIKHGEAQQSAVPLGDPAKQVAAIKAQKDAHEGKLIAKRKANATGRSE